MYALQSDQGECKPGTDRSKWSETGTTQDKSQWKLKLYYRLTQ